MRHFGAIFINTNCWSAFTSTPISFRDRAFGPAGLPLSPLLYVLALEPLLRRLRDVKARPALRGVSLTGSVRAKISAYAVFVRCLRVQPTGHIGSKDGCREVWESGRCQGQLWQERRFAVGCLKGASPCQGPSAGVTDPSASSSCGSDHISSWGEIGWKYGLR